MSENKQRTLNDIQLDYTNAANKVGHENYVISQLRKQQDSIQKQIEQSDATVRLVLEEMEKLSKEASELKNKELDKETSQ